MPVARAALLSLVIVAGLGGLFVVDVETQPEPVAFDETVSVGLTLEDELRIEASDQQVTLPRVQVFYSQYPYAVGYYGVEQFVTRSRQPAHERRFGYPLAAYVTVYDDAGLALTDDGLPTASAAPTWHPAGEAVYVVDSDARTPAGETVVPFAERSTAAAFADEYGGTVASWETVRERSFDVDDATAVRDRVALQHARADALVSTVTQYRDRPVSVVVGEDAPTVQAAVDAAPPNTTVAVPGGVYREHVTVDKPLTVAGTGETQLVGDGNGTVVRVRANRTALVGLTISGVGDETPGAGATEGHNHDHGGGENTTWDEAIEDDYGSGDAGVAVDDARRVLLADVAIHTPASGVMLRDSPDAVVRNTTVVGRTDYVEAHMGVVAMRSPAVVEHSSFTHGLDAVYTHRADGIVVRNNTMAANRMGVHLMHTSEALIADNTMVDQVSAGVFVMTGPERNGLVGNTVRNASTGIDIGGTDSYIADNVLAENEYGLRIETASSVFERNALVDNRIGAATWSLLPTNRVAGNDFLGNDRHVLSGSGPVRIWTHDGRGNYWEGSVGTTDGVVLDRPYTPTDTVDSRLHRVDGTPTLAQSPARDALVGVETAVSGARAGAIVDTAPRCDPVHEGRFADRRLVPTCNQSTDRP